MIILLNNISSSGQAAAYGVPVLPLLLQVHGYILSTHTPPPCTTMKLLYPKPGV